VGWPSRWLTASIVSAAEMNIRNGQEKKKSKSGDQNPRGRGSGVARKGGGGQGSHPARNRLASQGREAAVQGGMGLIDEGDGQIPAIMA